MTEDELKLIEECGRCYMSIADTAVILMLPPEELQKLMKDKDSEVWKRYHKGQMVSELKIRASIITMAQQGSSQAQELWNKLRSELHITNA